MKPYYMSFGWMMLDLGDGEGLKALQLEAKECNDIIQEVNAGLASIWPLQVSTYGANSIIQLAKGTVVLASVGRNKGDYDAFKSTR